MSKDIGFCSITEDLCKKDGKCEDCSLKHIHENIEHYAKLHEENRLIELPCKVGTPIHYVSQRINNETFAWEYFTDEYHFEIDHFDEFGKTIFLTKEEAEAKLAEINGENI